MADMLCFEAKLLAVKMKMKIFSYCANFLFYKLLPSYSKL